ncbi:hypothetical protein [Micrococcoides hystricis]|uniref:DUF222 domain-containing protein n=1 Tax=Micrococcoides hystricis TaxID=1572761 RepID=A0ABV6PCS6_9MICC
MSEDHTEQPHHLKHLLGDTAKVLELKNRIVEECLDPNVQRMHEMAYDLHESTGVSAREAQLYIAHLLKEAAATVLYWQVAEAAADEVPDEQIALAVGMEPGSSIRERWPGIDKAVEARERVAETLEPVSVDFGHGFTLQMHLTHDPRFDEYSDED